MNWQDPAIVSAIIQGVAAVLAAVFVGLYGKEIANRKKLQCKLVEAVQDVEFLLAVEELHCANNVAESGSSQKLRVRADVRKLNPNLKWSGQYTPGRANDSKTLQKAKVACAIPE